MTAPRPGALFHLELDGVAIVGRYVEVDPPHRLVIDWARPGSDVEPLAFTSIEITLTPTAAGTLVRVRVPDLSDDETALYSILWTRYLERIATLAVASIHS